LSEENEKKSKSEKITEEEIKQNSMSWSHVLCTQDIPNKESSKLLEVFITRFNEILGFQKDLLKKKKHNNLYDLKYVSADWTNGNFGCHNGFIALFNKERRKIFENLKLEGQYDDAEPVGCGDHLANIVFRHTTNAINEFIPNPKAFSHLKYLYKRLVGLDKQNFKGYCYVNEKNPPSFSRMTENRFGSFYICALKMLENMDLIKGYCQNHLSDLENFKAEVFFSEDCQEEVFFMAMVAKRFLLPFMKEANHLKKTFEIYENKRKWADTLQNTLKNKDCFLKFWFGKDLGTRRDILASLFEKHEKSINEYLFMIKKLPLNSFSRCKNQKDANKQFFFKSLGLDKNDNLDHHYISFCLFIEFACEAFYCLEQRNIRPKLDVVVSSGTNRSGERVNGRNKKEYEKNPNTNCITIESKLKVKQMFPNHTFLSSFNSRHASRNFHRNLSVKGVNSYKYLARKRLKDNSLKIHQINIFKNKENREEKDPKDFIKEKVRKLALDIHNIIISHDVHPSQNPTQIEEMRNVDDSNLSYSASESSEISSSKCFFSLHQKVLVNGLQNCLSFLLAKSFLVTTKVHNLLKEELMDLFISEAEEFLKLSDKSKYFAPIQSSRVHEDPQEIQRGIILKKFQEWIHNDPHYNSFFEESHVETILSSSVNTLCSFVEAKTKKTFLNLLRKKLKGSYAAPQNKNN
jgi:hypothetical protein